MVRLKDIADKLSLDISTVSRALKGSERVKPDTKKLVLETADEMGYKPNLAARALAEGRSRIFWFITPSLNYANEREIAYNCSLRGYELGYEVHTLQYHEDLDCLKRQLDRLDQGLADGAVLLPPTRTDSPQLLEIVNAVKSPLVLVDRDVDVQKPLYSSDNAELTRQLVRSLKESGVEAVCNLFKDWNEIERQRAETAADEIVASGMKLLSPGETFSGSTALIASVQELCLDYLATASASCQCAVFDSWEGSLLPASKVHIARQDNAGLAADALSCLLESLKGSVSAGRRTRSGREILVRG